MEYSWLLSSLAVLEFLPVAVVGTVDDRPGWFKSFSLVVIVFVVVAMDFANSH